MHTARIIVNSLAFVSGLFGLAWALVGPVVFLGLASGAWPTRRSAQAFDTRAIVFVTLLVVVLAIIGVLMLRQVWKHLRRPDLSTARVIVGFASFLLGFYLLRYGLANQLIPDASGALKPIRELACIVGALFAGYLVYRLAFRRLADTAFPPTADESRVA